MQDAINKRPSKYVLSADMELALHIIISCFMSVSAICRNSLVVKKNRQVNDLGFKFGLQAALFSCIAVSVSHRMMSLGADDLPKLNKRTLCLKKATLQAVVVKTDNRDNVCTSVRSTL